MYLRSFDYRRTNFCLSVQIVECGAKSVNGKNKEEVFFYSHLFAPSLRSETLEQARFQWFDYDTIGTWDTVLWTNTLNDECAVMITYLLKQQLR